MSPQKENGYSPIANEILENVARMKLNGTQYGIILLLWRYTYGFNRKETDLSVSFIAKALCISTRLVQREINTLIKLEIIIEVKPPSFNSSRVIAFNKYYRQEVTNQTSGDQSVTSTGDQLDVSTGDQLVTQENKPKDNTKYRSVFDYYLTLDLKKHRKYTEDMREAMKHAERVLKLEDGDMVEMLRKHEQRVKATKNNEYPVKARGITEFFGQKKHNSKMLICADYLDENYKEPIKKIQPIKAKKVGQITL